MSNFTTDNVDIAIAYPNVGEQTTPVVLRRAIVKHRRYASSPQHAVGRQDLVESTRRAMARALQRR